MSTREWVANINHSFSVDEKMQQVLAPIETIKTAHKVERYNTGFILERQTGGLFFLQVTATPPSCGGLQGLQVNRGPFFQTPFTLPF